jgi:hypothetical protein
MSSAVILDLRKTKAEGYEDFEAMSSFRLTSTFEMSSPSPEPCLDLISLSSQLQGSLTASTVRLLVLGGMFSDVGVALVRTMCGLRTDGWSLPGVMSD